MKTQQELEAQSREAIKAWCDDPSVQLEFMAKAGSSWIAKIETVGMFCFDQHYYRIAKPRKFYRVAKMQDVLDTETYTLQATSKGDEEILESDRAFVEWLDERRYYD